MIFTLEMDLKMVSPSQVRSNTKDEFFNNL